MKVKVIVVDDHEIMREGLKSLFEHDPEIEVIGEAEDGRSAIELTQRLAPDVVIIDIVMPELNGIDATRIITSSLPSRVVVLSMHSDREVLTAALEAGAMGYVLKEGAFSELAQAVRAVYSGKFFLSPSIAGYVVKDYVRQVNGAPTAFRDLTPRERQVLQLLAEGKSTKQMALLLDVSTKTIEVHRHQIMSKLKIFTIAELTKYAIREKLTQL